MPTSWQKVAHTPPICITIRLPCVSQCFCRSIRVKGRWDPPYYNDSKNSYFGENYHWSKNHYTQLLLLGKLILQLHTHQLHSFNCGGINLCNACVSLVSACLASMTSQKGNYTTIMLGELISNCTHTSYTSIIVGELHSSQKRSHTQIFVFGISCPKNYISVTRKYSSGINFPKITYHAFVCDSENYMDRRFGNYFLGKSHFSYTK